MKKETKTIKAWLIVRPNSGYPMQHIFDENYAIFPNKSAAKRLQSQGRAKTGKVVPCTISYDL